MAAPTIYEPGTVEPGPRTTEFWQTLIFQLIAATVAVGSLFDAGFNLNGIQALVPTIATVAAAIVQGFYTASRSKVKAAALNSLTSTAPTAAPSAVPAQAQASNAGGGNSVAALNGRAQTKSADQPSVTFTFANMGIPIASAE